MIEVAVTDGGSGLLRRLAAWAGANAPDLRVTEAGEIYVIEVNASCYLEQASEFATAAAAAGLEYPDLIERILQLAKERHKTK